MRLPAPRALGALLSVCLLAVGAACVPPAASIPDDDASDAGGVTRRRPDGAVVDDDAGTPVILPDGGRVDPPGFTAPFQPTLIGGGADYSCALLANGSAKCWGRNDRGQLGQGHKRNLGDDPGEMGGQLPPIDLGGKKVVSISAGWYHACALLEGGQAKCWGQNDAGQAGQGDTRYRGDDPGEMGNALPPIDLGKTSKPVAISAGGYHACVLFEDGRLKCWGANTYGQLGIGDREPRGDGPGEMGDALPFVDVGGGRKVKQVSAGNLHTCAALDDGTAKCWGAGGNGQLGIGDALDYSNPPGIPLVDLGAGRKVSGIYTGGFHTCAVLEDGAVKCFGANDNGQLGQGDTQTRGDAKGQMGDALPVVPLGNGVKARAVSATYDHSCALLEGGAVKCWGLNNAGQLGLGDTNTRGNNQGEMGDALPAVKLGTGRTATNIGIAWDHSCARLDDGNFKCWGLNAAGHLGLGDTRARGDDGGEMGDALPNCIVQ